MQFMPPRELPFPRQFRPSIPEYRIYDLNKRLSMRTEDCDHQWWELFANDFFEDDATILLSMYIDDGLKRFHIGRSLIGRFFRTLFDGGVSEVYFQLRHSKEIFHQPTITVDCEHASLVTCFGRPAFIKVTIEGHMNIEFTFDDLMRIKSMNFSVKQHRELIPRSIVAIPTDNPNYLDQLSKNYTRNGLTSSMLNFLRTAEILEPMQEIMSRHKTTSFSPRDCLKTILHQRWSKTCSDTRPAPKTRRKRKNATAEPPPMPKEPSTPTKKRSSAPPSNQPGDVMIVGEPSLMGGEMDDEDERYITRLENTQFDSKPIKQEQTSLESSTNQNWNASNETPTQQTLLTAS